MLKNISQLQVKIADKDYHFSCESDSPLPHAKEALLKFIYYLGQIEEQVTAQQKAAQDQAELNKKEEPQKVDNGDQQ